MLPTRARFRGDKLFSLVYKKGWRLKSNSFMAYYYKAEAWRVAVVVSKKVANKANVRNLIRRRFFASVRGLIKENLHTQGYLILVANKNAVGLNYANINIEIKDCLDKLKTDFRGRNYYDKKNTSIYSKNLPKNTFT